MGIVYFVFLLETTEISLRARSPVFSMATHILRTSNRPHPSAAAQFSITATR